MLSSDFVVVWMATLQSTVVGKPERLLRNTRIHRGGFWDIMFVWKWLAIERTTL